MQKVNLMLVNEENRLFYENKIATPSLSYFCICVFQWIPLPAIFPSFHRCLVGKPLVNHSNVVEKNWKLLASSDQQNALSD